MAGEPKPRRFVVWTLIVLTALVTFVSSLVLWAERQALDTDEWVKVSVELLEDDAIRGAIADFASAELFANVDVEAAIAERLPEDQQGIATIATAALREVAPRAVDQLLQRPRVQDLWAEANRVAHELLIDVLEGGGEFVSTEGGVVVLDLRTLVVELAEDLGIGESAVEAIPEDVGQIEVLESDELEEAQTLFDVLRALSILLVAVALVLAALALWLARGWRREALRGLGVALVFVGLLLLAARTFMGDYIVGELTAPGSIRDAADSAWEIGTSLLSTTAWALILYSAVILVGTLLAGPSDFALRFRRFIGPYVESSMGAVWTVTAVGYLLLVWWGPIPALRSPLGVVVLAALLAIGVEAFRRVVISERRAETPAVQEPPAPPPVQSG